MDEPILSNIGELAGKLGPMGIVIGLLLIVIRLLLQAEQRHKSEVERMTAAHKTEMERITKAHDAELEELRSDLDAVRTRVDSIQSLYDDERQKRFAAETAYHLLRIRFGVGGLDEETNGEDNA